MKAKIGVSKRHVHLTKETFEKLFGHTNLEVRNNLNQPGQFASTTTVNIKKDNQIIEKLRVVGPFRNYDQVEIAASDAKVLNCNPPRRRSGDLSGSLPITIIGPNGEVQLNEGLILVERHIHFTKELADEFSVLEGELLNITKDNQLITTAQVKIEKEAALEIHIDTDEEEEFNLHNGDEVDISKCNE